MDTVVQPMYEWNTLPWKTIEREVFKLQKRIYQASQRGEVKTVHKLQRLLAKSWYACLFAVRRVTQDNQGKKTAGVDGVKNLSPPHRLALAEKLKRDPLDPKAQPTRRVWIPKPGTDEHRALGIPVMEDRARQALVKMALEPEWEAKFEPNSYGFRPGRSCQDAVAAVFDSIKQKAKYVLDADIAKCFDRINHNALVQKLNTFPKLRRVVKAWLQAGVMDNGTLFPTATGTPQGGVASPLLANIALHGLETTLVEQLSRRTGKTRSKVAPTVIRYADDFVVLDEDVSVIQQAKELTVAWLAGIGLELKPSKTTISHTLHHYQGNVGFHFLGFAVRQVRVGKTHTGCNTKGKPLGFKTIIMPGKAQVSKHLATLKDVIRRHKAAPQVALIQHLNPVIHGWANYYATVCSTRTFAKADHLLYLKLAAWARRRHRRKNLHWIARKYWHVEQGTWNFATPYGLRLARHNETPIKRHIKVAGRRSPYDGDWVYWATRMGQHPELPSRIATLLKRQQGRCQGCGLYFKAGDLPEIDHVIPTAQGGQDTYSNWQLLHRHCHDQKTAADTAAWRGAHDKSQRIEEPDEVKASRPVLKTSRGGDCPT